MNMRLMKDRYDEEIEEIETDPEYIALRDAEDSHGASCPSKEECSIHHQRCPWKRGQGLKTFCKPKNITLARLSLSRMNEPNYQWPCPIESRTPSAASIGTQSQWTTTHGKQHGSSSRGH